MLGPLIGGFVFENKGWRWLYWLQLIICGFLYVCILLFVPETYAPVLLARKAEKLRNETGDDTYVAQHELSKPSFKDIARVYLARPLRLLLTEPIVTLFSIYAAVVYGVIYMFFVAYVFLNYVSTRCANKHSVTPSYSRREKGSRLASRGLCSFQLLEASSLELLVRPS